MSIRVDERRRQKLEELEQALSPIPRNRTHLILLMIDFMYDMVFTWQMLHVVAEGMQRLMGVTRYYKELPSSEVGKGGVADQENSIPPSLRPRRRDYDPLRLNQTDAGRDNRAVGETALVTTSFLSTYCADLQVASGWLQ